MSPNQTPIAAALMAQLVSISGRWPSPKVLRLHIPQRSGEPGEHDAEFCAIELDDGAFGLSYILLGHTLDLLLAAHGSGRGNALAGADPMVLAQRLADGDEVERAVALAAINALTDSVWRRVGYQPPPAGNSLGDVVLGPQDHLGMIGFFPPLVRRVDEAGGRLTVIEMNADMVARQQERFPKIHITLDRTQLAHCNTVVGTSTMLLNDTLDDMLSAAPAATRFAVIGPSAGLWPDALFERGVTLLGGTQVVDGAAFAAAMAAGESWSGASRKFAIASDGWPGWQTLAGR
ncbi:Rossmann-like domain-containing protein [Hydrogenophaga sp. RWCD_12]|uniref:Rossmann-like domain-containing protein n=1 Tax=Hydrogenophaga sp. RWCD_12 TaxID=3391190 RepID=UPI0039852F79